MYNNIIYIHTDRNDKINEKKCSGQHENFTQFTDYTYIGQIKNIIHEMHDCSNEFVKAVSDIKSQIDNVQNNPDGITMHTEDVIKKVEQTKKITEDLTDIVRKNEENALAIKEIMNRFSL